MLDEKLGKWNFWLLLIGFHLTFDFMHIPGLLGMPRQIYTYEADRGWGGWNMIVTVGGVYPGDRRAGLCLQHCAVGLKGQGGRK